MARRITKSAINWAKFIELVPKDQTAQLNALRGKHDTYLRTVQELPENVPAIDFALYKSRIANPKIAEDFEAKFKALKIPYPEDHYAAKIDQQAIEGQKYIAEFIASSKQQVEQLKDELAKLNNMVALEHMTMEDRRDYFPEDSWNPDKPTYYPHDAETQQQIKEGDEEEAAGVHQHH